ncbi:MAG TPA: tetratricopeptide repeat protein [Bryobacteraceae bacterium]|nr:tetratricopeptide repeat protein [Bryobacteraceae bacterium]HPT25821.1 tetratricopeptide repeat protein [Bryobacteraceae bacterium]
MKSKSLLVSAIATILMLLSGCSRDPEVVKRRYLENGNKYFAQGKYKEAVLMYRNAVKQDPKFGEAYLKLGEAELRRGAVRESVNAYRRAVELLPKQDDAAGKLADIYLTVYALSAKRDDRRMLKEVEDLVDLMSRSNPKSYHVCRLRGFLAVANDDLPAAIEQFQKADQIKPKQPELLYALTQVLFRNKQVDEAEQLALRLVKESPKYPNSYAFLVGLYRSRQQFDKAESVLKQRIGVYSGDSQAYVSLAAFFITQNRRADADRVLNEMLSKASTVPRARSDAANFYFQIRDFDRAKKILEDAVTAEPQMKNEHRRRLAVMQFYQGQPKQALEAVEAIVKDDPRDNNSLALRAAMQLQSGDADKSNAAINDLQALLGRVPQNPAIRYNLARAYQARGELDAARVQYAEAIKQRPSFIEAHIGLGQVALQKQDFGRAIESADAVLRIDPKNVPARVIKVNGLLNSGNLIQARQEVNKYLAESRDQPDLRFQQALVCFMEKNFPEAERIFRSLRERYPGDLRLLFGLGETLVATGRGAQALEMLKAEAKARPQINSLRMATGNVALRIGDLQTADQEYRHLLSVDPKNLELYLRLGATQRLMRRTQEALQTLRRGQALQPNNPQVNLQLALTLDAAGLQRESLPIYENIVRNQPDNAVALNNLAYMMAEEGRDLDLALTYAQRARQQQPSNLDIADTLGWVYIRKQLSDSAVNVYREIVPKSPKNPVYHLHMGMALFQKGDKPAAKRSLQTALNLNPSPNDLAKIKELLAKIG